MKQLLWVDAFAGLLVGVVSLSLLAIGWLGEWYGLPQEILYLVGGANAAYGLNSLVLARRAVRPEKLIVLLVCANLMWAVVCVILTVTYWKTASFFGLGHLIMEVLFVGGIGCLEWRWRTLLLTRS